VRANDGRQRATAFARGSVAPPNLASGRENDDEAAKTKETRGSSRLGRVGDSGAARTMRSITSPSTRRSRASSLRRGEERGKVSGGVSVCGGAVHVGRGNLIHFSCAPARGRDGTTRENRVAASCAETRIVPRELAERFVVRLRAARHRRARRTLPAAPLRSTSKSLTKVRGKSKCYGQTVYKYFTI
jgi:hypothetical protein